MLEIVIAELGRNRAIGGFKSPVQLRNINHAAFEGMKQGTFRGNLAKFQGQHVETD